MLTGYPESIWLLGLTLFAAGAVMAIGSIKSFQNVKKEKRISDEQMALMINPSKSMYGGPSSIQILASWNYSISDWKRFLRWEHNQRRSQAIMVGMLIVGAGTLLLRFGKGGDWATSLLISSFVGLLYIFGQYFLSMGSLSLKDQQMPEVLITNEAIIVNGKMNCFYGNNLWLGKVSINETVDFNILEITYCWNTRKGKSMDEIRVPIPKGYLKEAIKVQEMLMTPQPVMLV